MTMRKIFIIRHFQKFMHHKYFLQWNINYSKLLFRKALQFNKITSVNNERPFHGKIWSVLEQISDSKNADTVTSLASLFSDFDLTKQSKLLPGADKARASNLMPGDKLINLLYEDTKTVYDVLYRGARISKNGPCIGKRLEKNLPYHFLTYNEVITRVKNFASGLIQIGILPGQDTLIGIYAHNCIEWIITEHACYHISAVTVPFPNVIRPNVITYIINEVELRIIICDHEGKIENIFKTIKSIPTLNNIIVMGDISEKTKNEATKNKVNIYRFKDIEDLGEKHPFEAIPPKPEDLCSINYTSGTTGHPKGVMITHANILSQISACFLHLEDVKPNSSDVMLSYLPLFHILERTIQISVYMTGGCVGFFKGDVKNLSEEFKVLKPTFIPTVPLLLNRMYNAIQEEFKQNYLKKKLLNITLDRKKEKEKKNICCTNTLWDKIIFKKVRDALGGRVRAIVIGSAPIQGNILSFMQYAIGCRILEGYGTTETTGACTLALTNDWLNFDHVGPPMPACHIKLVDVPKMHYYAKDNIGEICIRGNAVFKGYFKNPESTSKVLDKDGWLHTDDIGMWTKFGALKIIDRKSYIFKLSHGEFIAPDKIENIYNASSYVQQIFVYGESSKSYLVAIVVPEKSKWLKICQNKNIKGNWNEICSNKEFKYLLMEKISEIGQEAKLQSFEQVKDIYVWPYHFEIKDGLLTSTLKLKRKNCIKFFALQIEAMYKKNET